MNNVLIGISREEMILNEFKGAFGNNEFYLVFQPQMDLSTHRLTGIEVLIRWENKRLGFIPPNEFICLAEKHGYVKDIGSFVLEESVRIAGEWIIEGYTFDSISINVSPIELGDKRYVEKIISLCKRHNVPHAKIQLEITEQVDISKIQGAVNTLHQLSNEGFLLAIDDYGVDNSIKLLSTGVPMNVLKLDKSLIDEIHQNRKEVVAIINLSRKLGYSVIAEGVETDEQLAILKELECCQIQGYHYSKPLKEHEIVKWL